MGAVLAVLLVLFLLTPASHAGSLVRRGGFRELSVQPADAAAGVELPDVFLIAGSDSVRVDGEALTRGVDYEIDYDLGIVAVISAIPDDSVVTITYRFIPLNLKKVHRRALLESLAVLPPGSRKTPSCSSARPSLRFRLRPRTGSPLVGPRHSALP